MVDVTYSKDCVEQMVTVCQPGYGGYGYQPKCKELAQETCFNKPSTVPREEEVTLMVPTPRLSQGLFNRLEPDPEDSSKDRLRQLASRHGIDNLSKPIPMASRIKLDMVVIGSVAVDRLGHRIGKGEGGLTQFFLFSLPFSQFKRLLGLIVLPFYWTFFCGVFQVLRTLSSLWPPPTTLRSLRTL